MTEEGNKVKVSSCIEWRNCEVPLCQSNNQSIDEVEGEIKRLVKFECNDNAFP